MHWPLHPNRRGEKNKNKLPSLFSLVAGIGQFSRTLILLLVCLLPMLALHLRCCFFLRYPPRIKTFSDLYMSEAVADGDSERRLEGRCTSASPVAGGCGGAQ